MEEIEKQETNQVSEDGFITENNKKKKKITTYIIGVIVIGLIFSGQVIMSSQSTSDWLSENGFFSKLKHLVPSTDKYLQGEKDDRINVLLLGVGGEGHEGSNLSDTIILLSLKPSTKQVAMISIPRDMTVPIADWGWRKVNHINALAEAKNPGSGGEAAMETLSEVLQVPIDYYVRVDFNGFIDVIDELGGLDVYVENNLDDYSYPILGEEENPNYYARYEHLSIEQGWHKMDGHLALKYARSRKALGIEGSDFARAKRQQNIIEATKNKLLSKQTLLNPVTIGKLINQFNQNVQTNFDAWEIIKLWNLFKDTKKEQIINKVLSDAPDGLLVSAITEEGAYILKPVTGNFGQIRELTQNILGEELNNNLTDEKVTQMISNPANVVVQNGTWITGLASKYATTLQNSGFDIIETGNALERDSAVTMVFDLTYGNKDEALNLIKDVTGAEQIFAFPDWLKEYENNNQNTDFVLILGTDSNQTN